MQHRQNKSKRHFKRWNDVLRKEVLKISAIIPDKWPERAVDSIDEQFIKEVLLQGQLLSNLGTNYISIRAWLTSFKDGFPILLTKFEDTEFLFCFCFENKSKRTIRILKKTHAR